MKSKEKHFKKLLVEGNDDKHVIWSLCEKYNIIENFDVIDCRGIDSLIEQIPGRIKEPEINSIGIIVDADINLQARWDSLSTILSSRGFLVPHQLPLEGLILTSNGMKIGVWIMPNNSLNGMLEDFITFLIPQNDMLLEVAKITLGDIEQQEMNKYLAVHKSKALVHSWLAWQEDPGTPMGLAITKKYLNTEEEICQNLINWIKNIFA